MDEPRRFLRYLAPGLLFVIEFGTLLTISDLGAVASGLEWAFSSDRDLGAAIGTLLVSGGLGALFSQIHHVLHWTLWRWIRLSSHHDKWVLAHADDRRWSEKYPILKKQRRRDLDGRGAWVIVTVLWHERLPYDQIIAAGNAKTVLLSDLMHSTGTMLVAALAAAIAWAAIGSFNAVSLAVAIGFLTVHAFGYWRTSRTARDVIESLLRGAMARETGSVQPVT